MSLTTGGISGTGSITYGSSKDAPIAYVSGTNTYTGDTYIYGVRLQTAAQGTTTASNSYALGSGNVFISGSGSLVIRNNSSFSNNFTIGGAGAVVSGTAQGAIRGSFGASGTSVISGSMSLSSDALIVTAATAGVSNARLLLSGPIDLKANQLTLTPALAASGSNAVPIEITGAIRGSGSIVVNGNSIVYLDAVNTYTGSTTVQSGTLAGLGTIPGAVTVNAGGAIAPGNPADATGTLSIGSLDLLAGSRATMTIGGTGTGLFDQLLATTSVGYGGTMAIDFSQGGFSVDDSWQLFSAVSHSGHFSSVTASGAYGNLTFSYVGKGVWSGTGGSLAAGQRLWFFEQSIAKDMHGNQYQAGELVLVPEPSTVVIAGIGMFIAGWHQWRRRLRERPPQAGNVGIAVP